MKPYGDGRMQRTGAYAPLRRSDVQRAQVSVEEPEPEMPVEDDEGAALGWRAEQYPVPEEPSPMPEEPDMEDEQAQVLATNRTVMLCCTIAAMFSPFAAFLLYAERSSRAIRHSSVQSLALGIVHILCGLLCLVPNLLLGGIPGLGAVVSLICWLAYGTLAVLVVVIRLRLMLHAWRGLRYDLPLLGWWLERFV